MSMSKFRRKAAKIDQHMQLLATQGVNEPPAIINRMMGYIPDLHEIWTGTTDQQLMSLSHEFPGFYRYAFIIEEASEAERNKPSRPYDGMETISAAHQQQGGGLLTTAATLERGYQALREIDNPQAFQPQSKELNRLHQQWLSDVASFKSSLRTQGTDPRALEYVDKAFAQLIGRIKQLAQ
ncbi:MAG: transposase [Thiolinea sp.]